MNKLNHLGIIADGNGRWAEKRGLKRRNGHEEGLHKIDDLMHWCVDLDIKILSVYVFSLENWNRPQEEVDNLFELANYYFDRWQEFVDNNIKVVISGCLDGVKEVSIEKMKKIQYETRNCDGLILNLCANYGGRREIVDAIANGARTEEEISQKLYQGLPDPDLIIRTGGHQRLSGFMLWQAAYSELHFTHTLFPDFSKAELAHIKKNFEKETRNFGGLANVDFQRTV